MAERKSPELRPVHKHASGASRQSGLEGDTSPDELKQDTPGRPKSASTREQTQPGQSTQSGSEELDSRTRNSR